MTSVIGKEEATAKSELEDLGLKVTVAYEENTSKDNGIVLKQSIDTGTTIDEGTTVTITVNKLEETKSATVTINVKSITGGYKETSSSEEEGNSTDKNSTSTQETDNEAKTVDIKVQVNGVDVYTDSNVDKNTTSKTATIQGKGTAEVKLIITDSKGGKWTRTETINFNTTNKINF